MKIYKHDRRSRVEQSFTDQQEDNDSHTEEIQSGPSPVPLNTSIIKNIGKLCNKGSDKAKRKMKENVLCFKYIKISTKRITKSDSEMKIESKQRLQQNKSRKTNRQPEE